MRKQVHLLFFPRRLEFESESSASYGVRHLEEVDTGYYNSESKLNKVTLLALHF